MNIRVKFSKHGSMKFIGHLDIMRFFQKAIIRAGIDITMPSPYPLAVPTPYAVALATSAILPRADAPPVTVPEDFPKPESKPSVIEAAPPVANPLSERPAAPLGKPEKFPKLPIPNADDVPLT